MKSKASKIKKRKQGDEDKSPKWARAGLNWIVQLMVRFGLALFGLSLWDLRSHDPETNMDVPIIENNLAIPQCFDQQQLGKLEKSQIAW